MEGHASDLSQQAAVADETLEKQQGVFDSEMAEMRLRHQEDLEEWQREKRRMQAAMGESALSSQEDEERARLQIQKQADDTRGFAVAHLAGIFSAKAVVGQFFEIAEFVFSPAFSAVALRRALVLHNFNQWLPACTPRRRLGCDRLAGDSLQRNLCRLKHQSVAEVGVVGDGQGIASIDAVDTFGLKKVPQVAGGR